MLRTMKRSDYEALAAAAQQFGGVGSSQVYVETSDGTEVPCCLWGLAIYTGVTKMSPYVTGYATDSDAPEWLQRATERYNEDLAPLPDFGLIDVAVDSIRLESGLQTYDSKYPDVQSRVPLDAVLDRLGITVVDDEALDAHH